MSSEAPTGSFHFKGTMLLPITLVIIETDPGSSARPAEAIRSAAGIGSRKKTAVPLLLRGPVAGYSLQEYADELVDEDNFTRYLPLVADSPRPIYLEDSFTDLAALEHSPWKYENIPGGRRTAEIWSGANDYSDPFMSETPSSRRVLHLIVEGLSPARLEEIAKSVGGATDVTEIFQLTEASAARGAGERFSSADTRCGLDEAFKS